MKRLCKLGIFAWALALTALGCSSQTVQGSVVLADSGNGIGNWQLGDIGSNDSTGAKDSGDSLADSGVDAGSADSGSTDTSTHTLQFVQEKGDDGIACVGVCVEKLSQNEVRTLKVRYLIDGKAVPDALVNFALQDPATKNGSLLSSNVPTDDQGACGADAKASQIEGVFNIVASVSTDPLAKPIDFEVHVAAKTKGPLTITLHYNGSKAFQEFGAIKARLTVQTDPGKPACKDIDLTDVLPAATWESPATLQFDKPWAMTWPQFAATLPQSGAPMTYTVIGLAYPVKGGNQTAAGCLDTGATVQWDPASKTMSGESVTVILSDLAPRLKGTYDLTTHLDLLSVLPPSVEAILQDIIDIVTDPVAGVLSLVCKLGNGSLDSFCKNVFDDPSNPNINNLAQPFGGVIVKFLDALLLGFLPENVKSGLKTGADVGQILTNLEIGGTLEIDAEPDFTGFVDKKYVKETWSTVTYTWTLGASCNANDPQCGKKTIDVGAFQNDAIVGSFDCWRDAFKSELKIAQHALNVKWGALVNFLLEKELLPLITGDPNVDSYGALFKTLVGGKGCIDKDTCCDDFGKNLAAKQGILGASFLSTVCESIAQLGSGFLEAELAGLDAQSGNVGTGSGLLLAADHCPLFDFNQDMVYDKIGAQASPCKWDMTLGIGGSAKPLKATFWATRQL